LPAVHGAQQVVPGLKDTRDALECRTTEVDKLIQALRRIQGMGVLDAG
jgi:hypothetical protein